MYYGKQIREHQNVSLSWPLWPSLNEFVKKTNIDERRYRMNRHTLGGGWLNHPLLALC